MKLAIAGIVKDEGPNLFEWALYHSLIGFDAVIVYNNRSTDDTLEQLAHAGRFADVRVVDWPMHPGQIQAYDHCIAANRDAFDYIAFLDADEFLVPMDGQGIRPILKRLDRHPHIAVHWAIYGSGGHKRRPRGLVTESYLARGADDVGTNLHVKSIVRPNVVAERGGRFINPHFVDQSAYVTVTGEPVAWGHNKPGGKTLSVSGLDVLRINHYYVKSREDYDAKLRRANADNERPREDRFKKNDRNDVHDPVIVERYGAVLHRIKKLRQQIGREADAPETPPVTP